MDEKIETFKLFENRIVESLAKGAGIPVELLQVNFAIETTLSRAYYEYWKKRDESVRAIYIEVRRRLFKKWRMSLCRKNIRSKVRLCSTPRQRKALILFYRNH